MIARLTQNDVALGVISAVVLECVVTRRNQADTSVVARHIVIRSIAIFHVEVLFQPFDVPTFLLS